MKILDIPRSGSYAGVTSSHNRAGQYVRNRRSPVQPVGTGRRAFIRAAFGAQSSGYAALTSAQQAAWASYAASHPYVDRLGQSIILTGQNMYVAINTQLVNCGASTVSVPPADSSVWSPSDLAFTATAGTPALSVTWTAGDAADYLLIAWAKPQSSGRSFVSNYWQEAVEAADGATYNALAGFTAQYGALAIGQRLFLKGTPVNQYGVTGVPVKVVVQIAS
jgi:hypothetical protein